MGPPETALLVFFVLLALALVLAIWGFRSRQRRESLRRRFGPEYERTREALSGDGRTDRELRARAKRVRDLHLRTLDRV
ncbi:MAG TPA: hypothetical protein VIM73_14560, partial [Polyangiaceae bacterium]